MAEAILTATRLRELLHYDSQTGVFTRLVRTSNRAPIGPVLLEPRGTGYLLICVDSEQYMAHRLAILYVQGEIPSLSEARVDHINGVRSDNRYENLRLVSAKTNSQNMRKPHRDNKSGFLGVARNHKKWSAYIRLDGKNKNVGSYDTPEEAHQAYLNAKRLSHLGCTI